LQAKAQGVLVGTGYELGLYKPIRGTIQTHGVAPAFRNCGSVSRACAPQRWAQGAV